MYYGLIGGKYYLKEIAFKICDILGNGKNDNAHKFIVETCGAETNFGTYKDKTILAGMGIAQFDESSFYDVRDRTNQKNKEILKDKLDINIDIVEWEHLRYNPVLSLIFTRLKYKLISEEIPETLEGRARYWKKYYNSTLGSGTIEHFIGVNNGTTKSI